MIAPADVAEKLLPKCKGDGDLDATECLENLIQTLLYKKANPIIEDLASSNDMKIEQIQIILNNALLSIYVWDICDRLKINNLVKLEINWLN